MVANSFMLDCILCVTPRAIAFISQLYPKKFTSNSSLIARCCRPTQELRSYWLEAMAANNVGHIYKNIPAIFIRYFSVVSSMWSAADCWEQNVAHNGIRNLATSLKLYALEGNFDFSQAPRKNWREYAGNLNTIRLHWSPTSSELRKKTPRPYPGNRVTWPRRHNCGLDIRHEDFIR